MIFHMVYKSGQIFLPFCHNSRVWRTNGRTDRILIAIPRPHYTQRGKIQRLSSQQTCCCTRNSKQNRDTYEMPPVDSRRHVHTLS